MQITVENVEYPSEGRKTGSIKAGGRFYKAWPDKLDEFTIGLTYEVEVEQTEYQGKPQSWIKKKPKLVAAAHNGPPIQQGGNAPAPRPQANGHANGARADGFRSPRQMFICEVASAFFGTGKVDIHEAPEVIRILGEAWDLHG